MVRLLALALGPLTLGAAEVTLITSDSDIRLIEDSGSIRLFYRNNSELSLINARVTVVSQTPAEIKVRPARIPRCQPADRCVFAIAVSRTQNTPPSRFLVTIKLESDGRDKLHVTRLFVDASPRAADKKDGWMDAGTIHVGGRSGRMRLLALAVVCAVPVILLLVVGTILKRRSRRAHASPPEN